jgi:hypothetical protein
MSFQAAGVGCGHTTKSVVLIDVMLKKLWVDGALLLRVAASAAINQYVKCPGGQLRPNRQLMLFSRFIQSIFASYMQNVP